MGDPFGEDISRFAVTFTRAIIAWNNAEAAARSILAAVSKANIVGQAIYTHLGNVALRDAILTAVDMMLSSEAEASAEVRGHVTHFVTGMDILRSYRNFYVHALLAIGRVSDENQAFAGLLHQREAKGRQVWITQDLTTDELDVFAGHVLSLCEYGEAIAAYLSPLAQLVIVADGKPVQPLSSLQKPPWPEKLKKNRSYL